MRNDNSMKKRTSWRYLKWIGLSALLSLMAIWTISLYWSLYYSGIGWGCAILEAGQFRAYKGGTSGAGWIFAKNDPAPALHWWWPSWRYGSSTSMELAFPVWTAMLMAGLLTLIAWRHSRRIGPGYCKDCSYDLTGNTSGVCPECGKPV